MKRVILLIPIIMLAKLISAQGNLVHNPSFELNTACPTTNGQFNIVVDWKNPTGGSPDYFHACGVPNFTCVPDNFNGYQAARTDSAYIGLVGYSDGYFEYIRANLIDSLDQGETYCVQYYVCLAERSMYATIAPQAFLSEDSIFSPSWSELNHSPQIIDWNIVSDTTNWILISGEFVAQGGEQYVTIGHFISPTNTIVDTINVNPSASQCSYFYIEDVSVTKKLIANAGNDQTICKGDSIHLGGSSINEVTYGWMGSNWLSDSTISNPLVSPEITTTYYLNVADTGSRYCPGSILDSVTITVEDCSVFNVPTLIKSNELFEITALPENSTLLIYDLRGRLVFKEENYQNGFSIIDLNAGMYLYQLTLPDQTIQAGKFCVVK